MSPRRTNIEIIKALKRFIKESGNIRFHKSDLRESNVGINPNTAYEWFKIIQFCQQEMPEIMVKEVGRNVYIEVVQKIKEDL